MPTSLTDKSNEPAEGSKPPFGTLSEPQLMIFVSYVPDRV